jgi:hypothetical protein
MGVPLLLSMLAAAAANQQITDKVRLSGQAAV